MASSGRRPKAGISCPLSTRLANRQDDGAQRRRYAGNHSSRTKSRNRGPPERPSAVCGAFPTRSARARFRASSTVMSAAGPTVALTGSPWTRPCQTKLRCPDGRTRTPRPDTSLSQTAYSVVCGFNLPTPASVSRTLRPFTPASPKGQETGSRRFADRGVGQVGVFQGGRRALVTEQAADGAHALPAEQRHAGVGVSGVVQADILQPGLLPHAAPEVIQPQPRGAPTGDREDPSGRPGQAVEDAARRLAQPDRARAGLAVGR